MAALPLLYNAPQCPFRGFYNDPPRRDGIIRKMVNQKPSLCLLPILHPALHPQVQILPSTFHKSPPGCRSAWFSCPAVRAQLLPVQSQVSNALPLRRQLCRQWDCSAGSPRPGDTSTNHGELRSPRKPDPTQPSLQAAGCQGGLKRGWVVFFFVTQSRCQRVDAAVQLGQHGPAESIDPCVTSPTG